MKSKKGFTFETRTTIIMLVVLAVSAIVMYTIIENVSKTAGYTACHDSIYAQEWAAKQFPKGEYYAKEFPSVCKPEAIIIEEEDKEAVKERILGLMDRCFWTYGKGDFFPFDKEAAKSIAGEINKVLGINVAAAEKLGQVSCAVCLTFEVKNMNGYITPGEMLQLIQKQTTKDGTPFYSFFNYPKASELYEMKSASDAGEMFGGVLQAQSIGKGTVYSINFVSFTVEPESAHPAIGILGDHSTYCYPR